MRTITEQSGFEWNFATEVIQRVPGLKPSQVTAQELFVGNDGRDRHMDFAIQVGELKLAIEVEGWDKTGEGRGKNKREHDEFNRRIQSLEAAGWRVLTVTNAQFMEDPGFYASQIRQMILDEQRQPSGSNHEVGLPSVSSRTGTSRKSLAVLAAAVAVVVVVSAVIMTGGSEVPKNPGNTKQCSDFTTYSDAKSWFDRYYEHYGDVAKLDNDADGEPCEELPGAP